MNCPTCHTPNQPDARFCMNCGASLSAETTTTTKPARRPRLLAAIIGGLLLVVVIVVLAIFLGPGIIGGDPDTVVVDPDEGITLSLAEGAQLTLLPEDLSDWVELRADAVPADQFQADKLAEDSVLTLASNQLPSSLSLQSPVYRFELVEGPSPSKAHFSLPVDSSATASHALDLYAWENSEWRWLPSQVDSNGQLIAEPTSLPDALAVMRREPNPPVVTTNLSPQETLPAEAEGAVTEILLTGFSPEANGRIRVAADLLEVEPTAVYIPSLRNWRDDGILTAAIGEILADPARRQRHIEAIVGVALASGYPAVQLDYRDLDPTQKQVFSTFITELAEALHDQDRSLYVRVEAPMRVTTTRWETGAYDWAAIAQAVDRLQVPLPSDPAALAKGEAEVLLGWAVGQVERIKLQPVISLHNLDSSIEQGKAFSLADALAQLGPLHSTEESDSVNAGEKVTLSLTNLASGVLEVDPASGMLHFVGSDLAGETHQLYLHTDTSLRRWLERLAGYNLAGVVIEHLLDESFGNQKWELVRAYANLEVPAVNKEPVWVWTVAEADNPEETLEKDTQDFAETSYIWQVPDTPGEYRVDLTLSTSGGTPAIPVANLTQRVVSVLTPTPSGTSDLPPTATPTPIRTTPTRIAAPSRTPTPSPTPTSPPPPPAARPYQLVYTRWDGYFHNLYIADSRTGQTQLILTHAAGPSFSPDKERLFFIGEQGVDQQIREDRVACSFGTISEGIVALDLPSPLSDICQVQADAWTCERKEIDIGLGPSDVCTANNIFVYQNLDWKVGSARWTRTSPTGDSVAYDAIPGGDDYRIYFRAVDPISQQFHFEIPGEQAAWSPDGERLVYRSGRNNKVGLWISNRDDSNPIRITDNGTDSFPTWSPDGRKIAFHREFEGDVEIFTVNPDGSNLQRLTNARGPDTLPVYTPDGRMVFRSGRNDSWGIWEMRGDGANQKEIIPDVPLSHIDWAFDRMDVR